MANSRRVLETIWRAVLLLLFVGFAYTGLVSGYHYLQVYRLEQASVGRPLAPGSHWPLASYFIRSSNDLPSKGLLVFALSNDCDACVSNVASYVRLARAAHQRFVNVLVLLDAQAGKIDTLTPIFETAAVVWRGDLHRYGIRSTPTVFFVDPSTKILLMYDRVLTPVQHGLLTNALGRPDRMQSVQEALYLSQLIPYSWPSDADGGQGVVPNAQRVLIANRAEVAATGNRKEHKHIPYSELGARALDELDMNKLVTLDCETTQVRICDSAALTLGMLGFTRVTTVGRGITPDVPCTVQK